MNATREARNFAPQSKGAPASAAGAVKAAAGRDAAAPSGGASASAPSGLTEKVRRDAATLRNALAFTQALGVLMRSLHYRTYTLADIEWLVIPPLMAGQFRIGEAKPDAQGPSLPVAAVFWASVSPEVDQRLMEAKSAAPQLKAEEWTSGEIVWLVHAAGETRFVRSVVDQLMKTTFAGRQVKVLASDRDGNAKVHVLDGAPSS
jgi:cytolysin-activating lysine-acyltransferase